MGLKIKAHVVNELYNGLPQPDYTTTGSAAIDLRACINDEVTLKAGHTMLIGSGVALELPVGVAGLLLPRSGIGYNNGIVLANLVGLIDFDYVKEVQIAVWNRSEQDFIIKRGDRICQLIFIEVLTPQIQWGNLYEATTDLRQQWQNLPPYHDGFGSTGID